MNALNVFVLHQIVGGLRPGALPHEEVLWCQAEPPESSAKQRPDIEEGALPDSPTQHSSGDATR